MTHRNGMVVPEWLAAHQAVTPGSDPAWYLGGGIALSDVLMAYAFKGAANLAAARVNLLGDPAYDLVNVAGDPTFNAVTGLTFDGTNPLNTGWTPTAGCSLVWRFANAGSDKYTGVYVNGARFDMKVFTTGGGPGSTAYANKAQISGTLDGAQAGVAGMNADYGYFAATGNAPARDTATPFERVFGVVSDVFYVGGLNHLPTFNYVGDILHLAVYSISLAPSQIQELMRVVAAL
jgi:hypothetical protein